MECRVCKAKVPDSARFCSECGAPLAILCATCGVANPPSAKFCSDCGRSLTQAPTPTVTTTAASAAERRQLTVLFCDIIGSTELSSRLDPEDLSALIRTYQKRVAESVLQFGGFIARYVGDGVLVYFGWPRASETDAEQAVRSALAATEAVAATAIQGEALRVRIGIASGLVVIGDPIGADNLRQQTAIGETPNRAARLQALAGPGRTVIDGVTRSQVGNLFDCRDLGAITLKGLPQPVLAFEVLAERANQSRFEALHATRLPPLIGRTEELELLGRRWAQAEAGEGRVALVSGEPGIGKSRLLAALDEQLQGERLTRLRYFCSPHHQDTSLHPIIRQFEFAAGFERGEPPARKLAKLEALLARSHASSDEVALIADQLSVSLNDRYSLPSLSPQRRKEKLLATLLAQLEDLASQRPLLIIFEDVHWIDPTSLELLGLVVDRAPQLRLLLVITARPEFSPPWPNSAQVTNLQLTRLSRRDAATMIDRVAGGKSLPAAVLDQILFRTEGVPLFLEELTKTVLEGDLLQERQDRFVLARPLPPLGIPTTLRASLMARLDRSVLAKEIAQIGAAIGREFSYALLRAVVAMDETMLKEALSELEEAELAWCRGRPPEATYSFKHSLVQDTAYASLVKSRRKELHSQIAYALRDRFPTLAQLEPEIIAHHFTEAEVPELAIEWWGKAGDQSLRRSAMVEASSHLRKATTLAEESGAIPVKDRLRLQVAYGQALMACKGYGAAETTAAFARARELVSTIEDTGERFAIFYGLWVGSFIRGELAPMREIASAFLGDVEKCPGLPEATSAYRVAGLTCWFEGDYIGALESLERAVAESDVERDRSLAYRFGQDPGIASILNLAITVGPLGDIGRAHDLLDEASTRARHGGHVPTIAYMHGQTCLVEGVCRDVDRVRPHARALLTLSREHGLELWLPLSKFFDGWINWHDARDNVNTAEMRVALAQFRTGFQPLFPLASVLLAEIEGDAGNPDAAISLLEELQVEIERTGQRWFDAEMHRQRGELFLRSGTSNDVVAEAAFRSALAVAHRQRARTFELRAAMRLARLWRDQGKRTAALGVLSPVCGTFPEGLITPDLRDARALLETLT